MCDNFLIFLIPAPSSSQATPPPWLQEQKPTGSELIQQLMQRQLNESCTLLQGSGDELEEEFSAVVRPVMESCTKDSIAVRIMGDISFNF